MRRARRRSTARPCSRNRCRRTGTRRRALCSRQTRRRRHLRVCRTVARRRPSRGDAGAAESGGDQAFCAIHHSALRMLNVKREFRRRRDQPNRFGTRSRGGPPAGTRDLRCSRLGAQLSRDPASQAALGVLSTSAAGVASGTLVFDVDDHHVSVLCFVTFVIGVAVEELSCIERSSSDQRVLVLRRDLQLRRDQPEVRISPGGA